MGRESGSTESLFDFMRQTQRYASKYSVYSTVKMGQKGPVRWKKMGFSPDFWMEKIRGAKIDLKANSWEGWFYNFLPLKCSEIAANNTSLIKTNISGILSELQNSAEKPKRARKKLSTIFCECESKTETLVVIGIFSSRVDKKLDHFFNSLHGRD